MSESSQRQVNKGDIVHHIQGGTGVVVAVEKDTAKIKLDTGILVTAPVDELVVVTKRHKDV